MKEQIIKNDNKKMKNKFIKYSKTIQIYYKSQNNNNIINYLIILLIIILLKIKIIHSENEITIIINGNGKQQILSTYSGICGYDSANFNELPNQIFVNGILQNYTDKYVYNLTNQINKIIMKWNNPITNCNVMFMNLKNIKKIDLSKFDSSQVTDMRCMFHSCTSLESLNLNNLKTSLVTNMLAMFSSCTSLKFLDLKSFDTSNVTSMWAMFYNCPLLISLDLSNFNTSKVNDMNRMFYSCTSLIRLNLINFNIKEGTSIGCMFNRVNSNLIYCINDQSESYIGTQLTNNYKKNCSDLCFKNYSKFIYGKNICIDDCNNDIEYKFEYNNICYNSCPYGTHNSSYNNYICEEDLICDNYYNYNYTVVLMIFLKVII